MRSRFYFLKVVILIIGITMLILSNTCKKEKDEDYCQYFKLGNPPYIEVPCNGSFSSSYSNIVYDRYGRVLQYEFTITCGSKTYSGYVYDVTYNDSGTALHGRAVINNQECSI